ncbi:MAG: ATP-binding protein [Acidobacteria bacterium]|nr:ATP-binding protein [Acidobacteriota bacterium]
MERDALIRELIRNYPDAVVLLNEHRQVVLANQEALRLFRQATLECAFGKRPGEALECIHSHDSPEGCGAGPSCRHCGLANAILSSWNRNQQTTGECSVTSSSDGATFYEMRVTASPLVLDGQPVTMAVLKDISAEKQRRVLERLFFHDVLNTVSGLCGLAQALQTDKLDNEEETLYRGWLVELTTNLEDEIQHHRALLLAERGEYVCNVSEVTLGPLLKELCALYCRHQSASGRTIRLEDPGMLTISTDAALLRRTLSNLLKNAIEATPTGGNVDVDARASRGEVCFTIRNPGTMPPEVSARLFHRFFSTKGEIGRGLGTYSAKLFGEKYLKGRLEFSSSEGDGTAFTLSVPRSL